jgi:xanthine dehydrogenase accessory factor
MNALVGLRRALAAGERCALATIVTTRGSTPGRETMKLLVRADGSMSGSVGGGCVEADVWSAARAVLASGEPRLIAFELTEEQMGDAGLICGGAVDVYVEPVEPDEPGDVWAAVTAATEAARPGVLLTRLRSATTTPVQRAFVTADGVTGDDDLARAARALADDARATECVRRGDVALGGETADVYAEPIAIPTLWIFGGGHVSKGIVRVATAAGFRVGVVDDREAYANPERFPEAFATRAGPYESTLARLDLSATSWAVIVTRGHQQDEAVLRHLIERPLRYLGMIGSRRKIGATFDRLRADGVSDESLRRVHAPLGLAIGAESSEEIAVAIVAELIAVRRLGTGSGTGSGPGMGGEGPYPHLRAVKGPFAPPIQRFLRNRLPST